MLRNLFLLTEHGVNISPPFAVPVGLSQSQHRAAQKEGSPYSRPGKVNFLVSAPPVTYGGDRTHA